MLPDGQTAPGQLGCTAPASRRPARLPQGILYTTPVLGAIMQHLFRRAISFSIIASAQLAAALWPAVQASAQGLLGGGLAASLKGLCARLWWQRPPQSDGWRTLAPYDPRL